VRAASRRGCPGTGTVPAPAAEGGYATEHQVFSCLAVQHAHAFGMVRFFRAVCLLIATASLVSGAEVLIVADEFPAMQYVAGRLTNELKLTSQVVAQKEMPASLAAFRVVIVYIHGALGEPAENAFIDYAKGGGKLVLLHHSISSGKRKNAHWFKFLGVALNEGDVSSGGYKWIEGITWDLVNINPNHFIMTNRVSYPAKITYTSTNAPASASALPGFTLEHSEVYINHVHTEPRTLLMGFKYMDAKSGAVYMQDRSGWIKPAGKGWVIYLMPGHTVKDFENPAYGQIVVNAVAFEPPAAK
jgi:hypothetical protein